MEIKTKEEVTYTLVINKKEALFLKGMVQNAMCHPNDEDPEIRKVRMNFWNNLPSLEELRK